MRWLILVVPLSGCAYDLDHLVATDGAVVEDAASDALVDAAGDASVDTSRDVGPVDAASCKGHATAECLNCCESAAPKAIAVLADKAGSCLCQDSTCKDVCSKEFCKTSRNLVSKECAACLGSACTSSVSEAKKDDPSVATFLACIAGC